MTRPAVSIIVPTKNRSKYLNSLISAISKWQSQEFELVVHDNSDEMNEFARSLSEKDTRIKYFHIRGDRPISMTENFDRALRQGSGKYITFLGDDDAVSEVVVPLAQVADRLGFDAVTPSTVVSYLWPDVRSRLYGDRLSGLARIRYFTGSSREVHSRVELMKCLRSGGQRFHSLPRSYYGVVKREHLQSLVDKCGTAFPGPSPDLSCAVALSALGLRVAEIDVPIFVQGTGASSNGGEGARGAHRGDLNAQPHLKREFIDKWSTVVPKYYSGPSIWAEDVVQALSFIGENLLWRDFNGPRLFAAFKSAVSATDYNTKSCECSYMSLSGNNGWVFKAAYILAVLEIQVLRLRSLMINILNIARVKVLHGYIFRAPTAAHVAVVIGGMGCSKDGLEKSLSGVRGKSVVLAKSDS